MRVSFAIVVAFVTVISGCAAAPGAPKLANSSSVQLPYCATVNPSEPAGEFTTEFYFTTWGSAIQEGVISGVRDVAIEPGGLNAKLRGINPELSRFRGRDVVARRAIALPFCMRIETSKTRVDAALSRTFSDLRAYKYRSRNGLVGPSTDLVYRSHRSAEWIDRFYAFTETGDDGSTHLYVIRQVYISRDNMAFVEATSVGRLETWILARTRDQALQIR